MNNYNLKIISVIILLVLLVLLVYYYNYHYTKLGIKHIIIEDNILHLTDNFEKSYSADTMPNSKNGEKYTMSFWMYINNVPENAHWKNDYATPKGVLSHFNSPTVVYIPYLGILEIMFGYKDNDSTISKYTFRVNDLKLQKWNNITIVVENRYVDIYINGVIYKSTYLPNIPFISSRMLHVGQPNNNFNGYVGMIEYMNTSLNGTKVKELYNTNINKSIFSKSLESYSEYYYNKNTNK